MTISPGALPAGTDLRRGGRVARSARVARRRVPWVGFGLATVLAIAAALVLSGLAGEGYANTYYAAAVRGMLSNWHAYFFASFDAGGFVTVDKPPLGLWVQAASAWLFGFHGWSLLLPQALAFVATVGVVFVAVRRPFGDAAGLVAALVMALTPVSVAVSRNNTPDALLILLLTVAGWAALRAARAGSLRWLTVAMVLVGLGFNVKMLQAWLVLPAIALLYLLAPGLPVLRRVAHLALASVALLVVSFSWATVVHLTPADQRPWIGSTSTNDVFDLIFGYNGIQRLLPDGWSILGLTNGGDAATAGAAGGGGVGGVAENGAEGVFRLLNAELGGQVGWLLPLAALCLVAAWGLPLLRPLDARRQSLLFWGAWLATQATFFSVAGFYHRYYLAMLAPPIAALVGAGLVSLWQTFRSGHRLGGLLPLVVGAGLVGEAYVAGHYADWAGRIQPVLAIGVALAIGALVVRLLASSWGRRRPPRLASLLVTGAMLALLAGPATWSVTTVVDGASNGTLPAAGPASAAQVGGGPGGAGGFAAGFPDGAPPGVAWATGLPVPPDAGQDGDSGAASLPAGTPVAGGDGTTDPSGTAGDGEGAATAGDGSAFPGALDDLPALLGDGGTVGFGGMGGVDEATVAWLLDQQGDTTYLLAVSSANQAGEIILATGEPVMALGGFTGSDPILDAEGVAALVADGTVRFFLLGGMGPMGGMGGSDSVSAWVQASCAVVTSATGGVPASVDALSLYDCAGAAGS